jgi:O-antigen/teichoic acid export membrane protein
MSATFVENKAVVRNALRNLLGQGLPLVAAFYCIPHLIAALGVDRFGFLTLMWMMVGYLSIFDLGLGQALTKLVAEHIGRGEREHIPQIFWTTVWLMLALSVAAILAAEMAIPYLVGSVLKLPDEITHDAETAFSIAVLSLPFVILSTAATGILEAHQRFDLTNRVRMPLGIFTFAAPLLVAHYMAGELAAIASVLLFGRFLFLCGTMWFCFKAVPSLRQVHNVQGALLNPLFTFGGWATLSNLLGPVMVYLDRFVIAALISMSAVAYYVTPYEVVTKLWVLPGALIGALFSAFAVNLASHVERTVDQFRHAMEGIFLIMLPITMVVMAYANEGLTLWVGHDFALHASGVFQILAIGVFVNSFGRVPFVFIQAAGRPDIPARLYLLELPLYLLALWYMLARWGVEGAAIAWVARIVLDNILLLAGCARIVPQLRPAMWRGVAVSILPCVLLPWIVAVRGLELKMLITLTAVLITAAALLRFRRNWNVRLQTS